jgi:hypothetical protein
MGHFSKEHSLPTFEERYASRKCKNPQLIKKWLTADHIVDQCYCDIVNGLAHSEVLNKLKEGVYDGQTKGISYRTAKDYLDAALQRLHYDFESQMEDIRADLYAKLLSVYNDAMKNNDRYNAVGALNTIMKLTGASMDKPQTAIQINGSEDGKVVVNFGFNNIDEE